MKILILASNPRKDINLDEEIRIVRRMIDHSPDREQFEIVSEPGVRVGDLQELLLRHGPQIVHFCGHGAGEEGLIFKTDEGSERWVRADALANMFGLNRICNQVRCVLLNACYSEEQANAIVSRIDYVVGMSHAIQDNAAIAFSKGFYLGLGHGCSIEDAFEFGRNAIQLEISGSSSKMRSAVTEQERRAEVVNVVAKMEIPEEHLKPILRRRQNANRDVAESEQPLPQAKREEIQLNVANVLTEETPSQKQLSEEDANHQQYREQVRDYLRDRKLADYEKILLEELREELDLSPEEAARILEEEQAPIRCAQEAYKRRLVALIRFYPFDKSIHDELKKIQSQRNLTDEEVNEISQPILEKAEADYQERQRQQAQQEYEAKLQRYEQEFTRAIDAEYPINAFERSELRRTQQALELSDEDVIGIEERLVALKEAEYQRRQAEEQRKQEETERQFKLQRQQLLERVEKREKLQRYEEEFRRVVIGYSRKMASVGGYSIESSDRIRLKQLQQSLELSDEDIASIEKRLVAPKEAENELRQNNLTASGQNDRGMELYNQGKLDEAIVMYRQAIQLDPDFAVAYSNLAQALNDQGKIDEAIAACRQAIQLDPNFATAHNNLGFAFYKQGELDKAIAAYRQAIQLDPNLATAHSNLGVALRRQGKIDEAVMACRRAIQLDPNFAIGHNMLGFALYEQGKLDEAIAAYRRAIQLKRNYAHAYNNLGVALYKQGKLDEAITAYRQAIQSNSNLPIAHENLQQALSQQQKKKFFGLF